MRFGDDFLASLSDSDSASGFILNTLKCCWSTFLVVRVNCRQLFNRFALICGDRFTFSRSIFVRSILTSKLTKLSKIVPTDPSSSKSAVRHLHRTEREKERYASLTGPEISQLAHSRRLTTLTWMHRMPNLYKTHTIPRVFWRSSVRFCSWLGCFADALDSHTTSLASNRPVCTMRACTLSDEWCTWRTVHSPQLFCI